MTATMNLNFDDGIKELTINNDPGRVLRVNLSDFGIFSRINDVSKKAGAKMREIKDIDTRGGQEMEKVAEFAKDVDNVLRELFDEAFYPGAAETVFMNMSLASLTKDGKTVLENFFAAFTEMMKPEFEEAAKAANSRIDEYKDQYDRFAA